MRDLVVQTLPRNEILHDSIALPATAEPFLRGSSRPCSGMSVWAASRVAKTRPKICGTLQTLRMQRKRTRRISFIDSPDRAVLPTHSLIRLVSCSDELRVRRVA